MYHYVLVHCYYTARYMFGSLLIYSKVHELIKYTPPTTKTVKLAVWFHSKIMSKFGVSSFVKDKTLFLIRCSFVIVVAVYVILNPILKQGNEPRVNHLIYLTNWSWIFNLLYFMIGAVQSALALKDKQNKWLNWGWKALFSIVQPVAIFVTVLFWVLLNGNVTNPNEWLAPRIRSGIEHLVNFVLVMVDLWFSNQKIPFIFVLAPINFMLIYSVVIICWKILSDSSYWPYEFLNSLIGEQVSSFNWLYLVLFVVGIIVVISILFFIVVGITRVREKRLEKKPLLDQGKSTSTIVVVD